ncbi:fatty-acid amide hydrolase 2-like [Ruditapes philippinarum]|uniref:fatty-acid amide hydrolase 2-like n=1 Tax=Ruditapes philippinarum TaxID=129788 RepID=UPI00295AE0AA|nr:fatty-acid amide hydrolase 2-like [Ruditapes philippinarum]XP_060565339.1 fatty-acid amide hydrolase 2-like [Ruditapes philippinarum]
MKAAKIIQQLLYYILTLLSFVITPIADKIFSLIYDGSSKGVPPVEDDILLQSATTLAIKIRSRELMAEAVMDKYIKRVTELHEDLNTVVSRRFTEAIKEARALDEELDRNADDDKFSEKNKPLLGVPMSVKEAFSVTGMPNSGGLVSRGSFRGESDCPVVQRLREAGAIPYCMTNTSELCMWYESANRLYGRSKNPYHTGRIVGGSSGGEGCNIASGGAVIGIGSDIGGSIRMPAFFNGIFGHKPSRGLVPDEGQFPLATGKDKDLLSTGPMCRYMDDILPMLRVMAGSNKQANLEKKVDVSKLCIYNIVDDGGSLLVSKVDPQLKQVQAKVVHFLETSVGSTVKTITIPKFKYAVDMWAAKMTTSGGTTFCEYMGYEGPPINPYLEFLKWCIGQSKHTLPAIALGCVEKLDHLLEGVNRKALASFEHMEAEVNDLLDENSVIIYPSHPKLAPYHNQPLMYPFNWAYTGLFNTLGLPVTQIPLGLSTEGLPLGVQIVAGMNQDAVSLAVAQELVDAQIAGWVNPGTSTA